MIKKCARCGKKFDDTGYPEFITCPSCRRPLPRGNGGCASWEGVYNPRITKASDLKPFDRDYNNLR